MEQLHSVTRPESGFGSDGRWLRVRWLRVREHITPDIEGSVCECLKALGPPSPETNHYQGLNGNGLNFNGAGLNFHEQML